MFFFRQFETFDPVSGDVPSQPFSYLPEIAYRARALLRHRTAEQITSIAKMINDRVEGYFSDLKYVAILELKERLAVDDETFNAFFEWDGGTSDNGRWLFKDEKVEELDIQTAKNTNEVDALKTIIEDRDSNFFLPKGAREPKPDEYPEGKDYELFAVLSLWQLADSMEWPYNLSIAGEYALKAMDAVCYAEHLREATWLLSYAKGKSKAELSDALRKQKSEDQNWVKSYLNAKKELDRLQKTARSKLLNRARHQKTNAAKAMAIEEWMKDQTKFPSAEKAGNHFADWLGTQGVLNSATRQPYEPRTVTGWIRAHAKRIGVRFR